MKRFVSPFLLLLTTLLGLFLRLINLTPFTIYPDSYLQLVMAGNILTYRSVIGWLGDKGMLYPDFIAWTRPFFPLLLVLIQPFSDPMHAAHAISLVAGILAIPVSYLFLSKAFRSQFTGLCGALLLALSFDHVIWGGFILTETLGVLMMLLFLWSIFLIKDDSSKHLLLDILSGILLAAAVLTRYEYILVIIPTVWLLGWKEVTRIITILAVAFFVTSGVVGILFPLPYLLASMQQFMAHTTNLGLLILAIFLIGAFSKYVVAKQSHLKKSTSKTLNVLLYTFFSLLFLLFFIHGLIYPVFSLVHIEVSGILDFFSSEPLLLLSFIIGSYALIFKKNYSLLVFSFLSLLLLEAAYYRANPFAQRYWTHLLPFLLIPASFGLAELLKWGKKENLFIKVGGIVLILNTVSLQAFMSYSGITQWQNGSWKKVSYEEKAGRVMEKKYGKEKVMLIASFPESYYYLTRLSTQSITDEYPFIYIPPSLDKESVIVIQDMGMHDLFPNFSSFLDRKMQDRKIESFFIHESYHYADRTVPEKYPIVLYQTTVEELRSRLKYYE